MYEVGSERASSRVAAGATGVGAEGVGVVDAEVDEEGTGVDFKSYAGGLSTRVNGAAESCGMTDGDAGSSPSSRDDSPGWSSESDLRSFRNAEASIGNIIE